MPARHIILVGACYMDTILSVPHYPEQDSKLRATAFAIRRGGNCPNTLEVLTQLIDAHGIDGGENDRVCAHLIAPLPARDSPAARRIANSFSSQIARAGLNYCLYRDDCSEPASSYIIRSEANGSRTIVSHNPLPEMTPGEFEKVIAAFDSADDTLWHFEGRVPDTALACVRLLRSRLPNARISVEVEKPGREGLPELASEADIVFYSKSWAESRGHPSAEACLAGERRRPESLGLCAWGADGAAAMSHLLKGCQSFRVDSDQRGVQVVDTVGAGDTLIAGMLYGLFCRRSTMPLARVARFAVDLATLEVQREGLAGLGADAVSLLA